MGKDLMIYFNFITNIFLLVLIFFGVLVYADSDGVFHEAEDVRGGIFGLDEKDVTSSFQFINPVFFTEEIIYLGENIDLRFVNENQNDSINSNMVLDYTIQSRDISNNSIGSIHVSDNSIGSIDILNNNVLSEDIQDGTINSVDVNRNSIQVRVIGSCEIGSFIRAINSDGSVVCELDDTGDVSGPTCHPSTGALCGDCGSFNVISRGRITCDGSCSGLSCDPGI